MARSPAKCATVIRSSAWLGALGAGYRSEYVGGSSHMALRDDDSLRELEEQLAREDPQFVRQFTAERPPSPRAHRSSSRWALIGAAGVIFLVIGAVLAQALIITAGLALIGVAVFVVTPTLPPPPGGGIPPEARWRL
jgi:hypothetical protein